MCPVFQGFRAFLANALSSQTPTSRALLARTNGEASITHEKCSNATSSLGRKLPHERRQSRASRRRRFHSNDAPARVARGPRTPRRARPINAPIGPLALRRHPRLPPINRASGLRSASYPQFDALTRHNLSHSLAYRMGTQTSRLARPAMALHARVGRCMFGYPVLHRRLRPSLRSVQHPSLHALGV